MGNGGFRVITSNRKGRGNPLIPSTALRHILKTQGKAGHYLGTEIDGKWWKRYRRDGFFARGNGKYWYDDEAFYFLRYLTRKPLSIPLAQVSEINTGKSHAGRWCMGRSVVKILWVRDGVRLSSGFVVAREEEMLALVKELGDRLSR